MNEIELRKGIPPVILFVLGGMILGTLLSSFTKFDYLSGKMMFLGAGLGLLVYLSGAHEVVGASLDNGGNAWTK